MLPGPIAPGVIRDIFPGGPGEATGLRPGDTVLGIAGRDVAALRVERLLPFINGPPGTRVALTIRSPDEPTSRDVTLLRADATVPTITARVVTATDATGVGYLRLYTFSAGADRQVARWGASSVRGRAAGSAISAATAAG